MDLSRIPAHRRPIVTALALYHIGAVAALFVFSWRNLGVAIFLYWLTVGLGMSMGYHRLHTHRSYRVPLIIDYFLAVCGALSLQGGPVFWVVSHRIHHQRSDMPGDPHSPRDGAWWSHMGWILFGHIGFGQTESMLKYAPDLAKRPFYAWLDRWHWVPTVALTAILLAIGGIPMVLWGICLRGVAGLHATWLINSATHMWGPRRFETRDGSRNNWWVTALTFGEGWHNNHHAHPYSARHGLAWYELDLSWVQISILKSLGLADGVRVAKVTSPMDEKLGELSPLGMRRRQRATAVVTEAAAD